MKVGPNNINFGKRALVISWEGFLWEGTMDAPEWHDYQNRVGMDHILNSEIQPDRMINLSVSPPNDQDMAAPSPAQEEAIDFQLDHIEEIKAIILQAILDEIPNIRQWVEEHEEVMPSISTAEDLRNHISLHTVSVANYRDDDSGGLPYVGYHFHCTWDEEHGLGVLMDTEKVHEIGGEDVCC